MKKQLKSIVFMLMLMILVNLIYWESIEASESQEVVARPKIKVTMINDNTGVKVTIGKTKGAEGYLVYIYGNGYEYDDYNKICNRPIGTIEKDGSKKRSFVINGLPEGEYSISVHAFNYTLVESDGYRFYTRDKYTISEWVDIKIYAPKNNERKDNNLSYDFSDKKKGDTISFGAYEQDDIMTNGKEPLEWIVLKKTGNKMLVISKNIIDSVAYNKEIEDSVTWKECSLREWLNKKFYKDAFSKNEKKMILSTKLNNSVNIEDKIYNENRTKDKVFILSYEEVMNKAYGFEEDDANSLTRIASPTRYAVTNGCLEICDESTNNIPAWRYWLRLPVLENRAYVASEFGNIWDEDIDSSHIGIRPCMWIKVKS